MLTDYQFKGDNMSVQLAEFWDFFHAKDFSKAQQRFDTLNTADKQAILAELFQKSEYHRKPILVSALRGTLRDNRTFKDFYQSWLPSDLCNNKVEVGGRLFQQGFPTPVRVINAINIHNSKEIMSIGISWVANEQEEQGLWDYLEKLSKGEDEINEIRHARIKEVMDRELLGLFRVETDDNLGSPF